MKKQFDLSKFDELNPEKVKRNLNFWQKMGFRLRGCICLGMTKKPDWTAELSVYLVKCPWHGLYLSRPHGHDDRLPCPHCKEEWEKINTPKLN